MEEAERFSAAAARFKKTIPVHLKVDTGMGRLGVEVGGAMELIEGIRHLPGLQMEGLYTHYSSVEDDAEFSCRQAEQFKQLVQQLRLAGIKIPCIHANNSGALLHQPDTTFSLVRPGLLAYGIVPMGRRTLSDTLQQHLRPALSLKCRVSLVKRVPAGKPFSYGHTFVSPSPMRVATLTAGYGDGYLRSGSSRARVLIGGERCRIIGRITMDQMLADVSELSEVECGDEAVLIGSQRGEKITANELAGWAGTIPWEILTNITYRVPRLYRGSQAA